MICYFYFSLSRKKLEMDNNYLQEAKSDITNIFVETADNILADYIEKDSIIKIPYLETVKTVAKGIENIFVYCGSDIYVFSPDTKDVFKYG